MWWMVRTRIRVKHSVGAATLLGKRAKKKKKNVSVQSTEVR